MLISPKSAWLGEDTTTCSDCDCYFKGTEVKVFFATHFNKLGLCCSCATAMRVQLFVLWQTSEGNEKYLSLFILLQAPASHPLLAFTLRKKLLTSDMPAGFPILFPHMKVKKATNGRVPQPVCQRRLAVTPLPAVFTLMSGMCVYVSSHTLKALHQLETTHTSFSAASHTHRNQSAVCLNVCFRAFDLKWSCEGKERQSRY